MWKPPHTEAQRSEDIRDLLLIIAASLTAFDQLGATEAQSSFARFLQRRRQVSVEPPTTPMDGP